MPERKKKRSRGGGVWSGGQRRGGRQRAGESPKTFREEDDILVREENDAVEWLNLGIFSIYYLVMA